MSSTRCRSPCVRRGSGKRVPFTAACQLEITKSKFGRFVWRSETPIGRELQTVQPDVPLHWVEIKGKMEGGDWVYICAACKAGL